MRTHRVLSHIGPDLQIVSRVLGAAFAYITNLDIDLLKGFQIGSSTNPSANRTLENHLYCRRSA